MAETLRQPREEAIGGFDGDEGLAEDTLYGGGANFPDIVIVVVE